MIEKIISGGSIIGVSNFVVIGYNATTLNFYKDNQMHYTARTANCIFTDIQYPLETFEHPMHMSTNNRTISIHQSKPIGEVRIVDIVGKTVYQSNCQELDLSIPLNQTGFFIVQTKTDRKTFCLE